MLEPRMLDFFTHRCPVQPGDTLLAAVSGGPDSVALLHLLLRIRDSLGMELHVAHLNHKMRGEESEEDARFVASLCEDYGLPLHGRAVDIPALQRQVGGSPEALARRERYAFLEEARAVAGARWVVTGHNADDQVETFLLNMLRGAGPRGLGGMLPVGPGPICRPLLNTWREQIMAYLEEEDLTYRLDSSNEDLSLTRNRVRHVLVPLLNREFGPGARAVLLRESRLMNELDDYLSLEGEEILQDLARREPDEGGSDRIRIAIPALHQHHRVVQRSVVRTAVEMLAGGLEDIDLVHIDSILDLLQGEGGTAHLDLPRRLEAWREYDTLVLSLAEAPRTELPTPPPSSPLDLDEEGELRWGATRVRWTPASREEIDPLEWAGRPGRSSFDRDALVEPVYLRGIRPGDRLEPLGMAGRQKLSDLLINRKVPRRLRTRVALLCDNGGPEGGERILWVVGHRRARHATVGPDATQVVLFEAETIV